MLAGDPLKWAMGWGSHRMQRSAGCQQSAFINFNRLRVQDEIGIFFKFINKWSILSWKVKAGRVITFKKVFNNSLMPLAWVN